MAVTNDCADNTQTVISNTYCVYMHTLVEDGRKYIGITKYGNCPSRRWGHDGCGYKSQSYFWRTIQKYGWNKFKHEIVFDHLTKAQACAKEQALIKLFNTQDPKFGFNITPGGCQTSWTPEQRLSASIFQISREALEYQYNGRMQTYSQCAHYFGCSIGTIQQKLTLYGIQKHASSVYIYPTTRTDITYELLQEQYLKLNKNFEECAHYFNCSLSYIIKLCHKWGLTKRPGVHCYNFTREELIYQYITLNKTQQEVADYLGAERRTINKYLRMYGITKKGSR